MPIYVNDTTLCCPTNIPDSSCAAITIQPSIAMAYIRNATLRYSRETNVMYQNGILPAKIPPVIAPKNSPTLNDEIAMW